MEIDEFNKLELTVGSLMEIWLKQECTLSNRNGLNFGKGPAGGYFLGIRNNKRSSGKERYNLGIDALIYCSANPYTKDYAVVIDVADINCIKVHKKIGRITAEIGERPLGNGRELYVMSGFFD